jgi:hypothetical protein
MHTTKHVSKSLNVMQKAAIAQTVCSAHTVTNVRLGVGIMGNELLIIDGSERWEGLCIRVDVLLNGEPKRLRLCASAIASSARSDPALTVSRNLEALSYAIVIACKGTGTHIREIY